MYARGCPDPVHCVIVSCKSRPWENPAQPAEYDVNEPFEFPQKVSSILATVWSNAKVSEGV
jgi:hypothetical protein